MPPMVARSLAGGSSESHWPRLPSSACSRSNVSPASTVTVRSPGSCSRMRSRRFVASTSPMRLGGAPTHILVPPPHGVGGALDAGQHVGRAEDAAQLVGQGTGHRESPEVPLEPLGEPLLFD